jgi:hypothetical protein
MSFNKIWFMVPYHIRKLPGMTLALLDIYETVFEFLNRGKPCFLSNQMIMERTGIKNDKTVRDGLAFFEKAGVLKRVIKNNQRHIVQIMSVQTDDTVDPVDNSPENCTNFEGGGSTGPGGRVCTGGGGGSTGPHNINKLNKEINKSFCPSDEQKKDNGKKHDWADKPKSPLADVTKQSTSYNPERMMKPSPISPLLAAYMEKLKKENDEQTNVIFTRTTDTGSTATTTHTGLQGPQNAFRREAAISSRLSRKNGVMALSGPYIPIKEDGMAY